MNCDVVVIGAGISGLVCTHELLKRGLKVQLLEAQSRVGGRIYTRRDPSLQTPIELGAEFIHGTPQSTMGLFESLGVPFYDACDNHLFFKDNTLQNFDDFWERMDSLMSRLNPHRGKDRSIHEFLLAHKNIDEETKEAFIAFVEGFHSADPLQMSEIGLALSEQTDEDEMNDSKMFRIPGGYDQLVQGVLHSLPPNHEILRLNTIVKRIEWKKNNVEVFSHSSTNVPLKPIKCKAVVVTVPLGVLKAPATALAAIEFSPMPKHLEDSLKGMRMGDVQRLTFRFRSRFWDDLSKEAVGFLHAGPDQYFPTWWTMMPMRTPLLVAWQGGPKANEMSKWSEEERVKTALVTLSELTGRSLSFIGEQMQSWVTHNWTMDPYFLGAYSYVLVDGVERATRFTKSVEDTIFFAGEATAANELRGTVNGAFDSGLRAAQQILKKVSFSLAFKSDLTSISP